MEPIIRQFTNQDLVNWLKIHGVPTFVGSSNRIFPDPSLKPIEVLNKLLDKLASNQVQFSLGVKWTGWQETGELLFKDSTTINSDIIVFALGGASWKVTGSDGKSSSLFVQRGINVHPFKAANCAFEVNWEPAFIAAHVGKPLKNIGLTFNGHHSSGELVISEFGLEGNAIYALSQEIQATLSTRKDAIIYLDLKPTSTINQLNRKYATAQSRDVTKILRNELNLNRTSIALLKQFTDKQTFLDPDLLIKSIKSLPIKICYRRRTRRGNLNPGWNRYK